LRKVPSAAARMRWRVASDLGLGDLESLGMAELRGFRTKLNAFK
jgi:hypothetical protein